MQAGQTFPDTRDNKTYKNIIMRTTSILIVTALLCTFGFTQHSHAAKSQQRNVLLISVDDLNDWVGCLGGHPQAKTPAIDSLAKRGTLFANAHCQSPVCNPSRASLLTGRYPHATGIYFLSPPYNAAPALKNVKTLPERFAADGYKVMGVGKIFHNRGNSVFAKVGEYGGSNGGFGPRPKKKISQPHGHPLWDWGAFPDDDTQMPDHKSADFAIKRLEQSHNKPFFLAVGFYRPHVPMYAPKKWFDQHPRDQIKLPAIAKNDNSDISKYAWDLTNVNHVSPLHSWVKKANQWEHAVQSYLASISFADHQVGRVLAALDQSKHKDNTVIVLFADHGFHLGEKDRWAKRTLWEDGTRVPLIVVDPARKGGQVSTKPAELIDIFPTLLALTGLKVDPTQQGQSLIPLLDNPKDESWHHPAITSFGPGNHAVRSERYRYIHYNDGSEELYEHATDPNEWHNLIIDGKLTKPKLANVLKQHRAMLPKNEHALLPGNSTGHKAFQAAEENRKK
jgi:choline-sulfatase